MNNSKFSDLAGKEFLRQYLSRIGYSGMPKNDLSSLIQLQRLHLLHVPFENLDIHQSKPITLDLSSFYDKIVFHKRGGFCYELNGLFNALLEEIGFKTNLVSARVFSSPEKYGEEYDHLCIIVFIDKEKWLADVGFGEFSFAPLRIAIDIEQPDERGVFKIVQFDETHFVVRKKVNDGEWKSEYLFSETPRNLIEFSERCTYQQVSPESHFTQNKMCSIATETGRITLTDKILKITEGDSVTETEISDFSQFKNNLKKYFEIEI